MIRLPAETVWDIRLLAARYDLGRTIDDRARAHRVLLAIDRALEQEISPRAQ